MKKIKWRKEGPLNNSSNKRDLIKESIMPVKIITQNGETKVEVSKVEWNHMGDSMGWFVGSTDSPYFASVDLDATPSNWEFTTNWDQETVRDIFKLSYLPNYDETAEIYEVFIAEGEDMARQWLTDRGLNVRDVQVVIEAMYLSNFSSQPPMSSTSSSTSSTSSD